MIIGLGTLFCKSSLFFIIIIIFFGKERIVAQLSPYLAGSDLGCVIYMCILQNRTRVVFLKKPNWFVNFSGGTHFLGPHCPQDCPRHRRHNLMFFSQAPTASAMWKGTILQIYFCFILIAHMLFPIFKMSLLNSGKLFTFKV